MTRCINNYQNKEDEISFASLLRDIWYSHLVDIANILPKNLFSQVSYKPLYIDLTNNFNYVDLFINQYTMGPGAFLTMEQYILIVSSLMGDGSMAVDYGSKNPMLTSYFKFNQCFSQSGHAEWCQFKYDKLENLCRMTGPSLGTTRDKKSGKTFQSYTFSTRTTPKFMPLFNVFYDVFLDEKKNKKRIDPYFFIKHVSAEFLASWYQDDGLTYAVYKGASRCLVLFTNGFTFVEVLFMSRVLNLVLGLYTYPVHFKAHDSYQIFISSFCYEPFYNLVINYMIKPMLVKLPDKKIKYPSRAKVKPIDTGRYTLSMEITDKPTNKYYLDFYKRNEIPLAYNRKKPNDRQWFLYTETIYIDERRTEIQERRSMVIKSNDINNFVRFFYGFGLKR